VISLLLSSRGGLGQTNAWTTRWTVQTQVGAAEAALPDGTGYVSSVNSPTWKCQHLTATASGNTIARGVTCFDGVGLATIMTTCKSNVADNQSGTMLLSKPGADSPSVTLILNCHTSARTP
jgi:hypothetical protein